MENSEVPIPAEPEDSSEIVNVNNVDIDESVHDVPERDMSEAGIDSEMVRKCTRLERQVSGYKQVLALRLDLLNIRERESKELLAKLKLFETLMSSEREARAHLRERIESAEQHCNELTEQVQRNAVARQEYETNLLNLSTELAEARHSLGRRSEQNSELEAMIKELELKCADLEQIQIPVVLTAEAAVQVIVEVPLVEATVLEIQAVPVTEDPKMEPEILESVELATSDASPAEAAAFEISKVDNAAVQTLESDEPVEPSESAESFQALRDELKAVLEKNRVLSYQMSLLNTLFTETEGTPIDFDRIKAIGDIVRESQGNSSFGSIVKPEDDQAAEPRERRQLDVSRIMDKLDAIEGHPDIPVPGEESCYTSVDTDGAPKLVLSVSRTFIKLKDLILEKKSLRDEIHGLKELNAKLETKVDTQERRLYRVAVELNKTWSLVSKLKAQHNQLHNSKAVQRYELQQKRKLLEKLKYDLKTSRDKWVKVRQKNCESQIEWQSIRDEFTRRRQEVCPSRESAFSSEALSSLSNENEPEESAEKAESVNLNETLDLDEKVDLVEEADLEEPELVHVHDEFVEDLVEAIDDIEAAAAEDDDDEVVEIDGSTASWDELVNKRALRLRILEEQCRLLYSKLQASTARNAGLASKLADLHSHYGSETSPEPSSSVQEPDETEIGCESSDTTDTAYASAAGMGTDDDITEVTSDNGEGVAIMSDTLELLSNPRSRSRQSPFSQSESDISIRTSADERRRVSVPTTTQDIIAELRTLIMDDEETSGNNGTSDNDYAVEPADMHGCTEEDLEPKESESRSSPPPATSDLNTVGRILIQQLPKRFEVLKEENAMLRERMTTCSNAHQSAVVGSSSGAEMELRNELELKQKVIEELTNKIQVATENYETINREHGRMAEYFKIKMQERAVQEQRKQAKAANSKNCCQCEKKFSLFKRKHSCFVCGHSYCADCLLEEKPRNESLPSARKQKKVRVCNSCTQRRRQLEAAVIETAE